MLLDLTQGYTWYSWLCWVLGLLEVERGKQGRVFMLGLPMCVSQLCRRSVCSVRVAVQLVCGFLLC